MATPCAWTDPRVRNLLATARRALQAGVKLDTVYMTPGAGTVSRRVWPLSLDFWGHGWTLTACCELRDDFRCFRLDRMQRLIARGQSSPDHIAGS